MFSVSNINVSYPNPYKKNDLTLIEKYRTRSGEELLIVKSGYNYYIFYRDKIIDHRNNSDDPIIIRNIDLIRKYKTSILELINSGRVPDCLMFDV